MSEIKSELKGFVNMVLFGGIFSPLLFILLLFLTTIFFMEIIRLSNEVDALKISIIVNTSILWYFIIIKIKRYLKKRINL
jgi:hypothetical protein